MAVANLYPVRSTAWSEAWAVVWVSADVEARRSIVRPPVWVVVGWHWWWTVVGVLADDEERLRSALRSLVVRAGWQPQSPLSFGGAEDLLKRKRRLPSRGVKTVHMVSDLILQLGAELDSE